MKTNEQLVEELKKPILQTIEMQEITTVIFKKILRQFTKIFVPMAVIGLGMIGIVIYLLTRPVLAEEISIDSINQWNKIIEAQRRFIQYDREDISTAREQLTTSLRYIDSVLKEKEKK